MVAAILALILSSQASRHLDALARKVAGKGCPAGARLDLSVEPAPGRSIGVYSLLTYPYDPENSCAPQYRNAWIAVAVEHGVAHFSPVHDGEPQQLGIGPDGAVWLYALWTMEAGIPFLWRTLDGRQWREVKLPQMRAGRQYSEGLERIGSIRGQLLVERYGFNDDLIECWSVRPRVAFLRNGTCGALQPLRDTQRR